MNIREIVEGVDPRSLDIIDLEDDNIAKATFNVPYTPTPEFEALIDNLVEHKHLLGDKRKLALKQFLGHELNAVQAERTMFSYDFFDAFESREQKIKIWMSKLF